MAGYSGTPLHKKLGIKAGHRVLLDGAPDGFETTHLDGVADGVVIQRRAGRTPFDVVVAFRPDARSYTTTLVRDIGRTVTAGSLWIAWPKKSSGIVTDISEDVVRREALATGIVDVKVCAIDDVWSGLKLVRRVADR